jgi:hypothetical protein
MGYLVTAPFFNVDKNGNHKRITPGTVLTKVQYNKLNDIKKAKCKALEAKKRQAPLSQEEASDLVYLYLNMDNTEEIVAHFLAHYPQRVAEGIICQLRILSGLDNTKPQDNGLSNPGTALLRAMIMQAPHRIA